MTWRSRLLTRRAEFPMTVPAVVMIIGHQIPSHMVYQMLLHKCAASTLPCSQSNRTALVGCLKPLEAGVHGAKEAAQAI